MNEFLSDYGLFLAKTVTLLGAATAAIVIIAASKRRDDDEGVLEIKKLNERYDNYAALLQTQTLNKKAQRVARKTAKRQQHERAREDARQRVFVLEFDGDLRASATENLAQEITALSTIATTADEVVVKLYSAGGLVHGYGLAAAQLQRLRDKGVQLTVAVDKVAASGGYMMACVANQIIAAPFAIIGSIGVVAQLPNFHRFLQKHDIDFELLTAGKYKRTLTVFGENTPAAREKFREELEATHALFKQFVATARPNLNMESVATGEYWHGSQALTLGLVDALQTSDDYLLTKSAACDVYAVRYVVKQSLAERMSLSVRQAVSRLHTAWQQAVDQRSLP